MEKLSNSEANSTFDDLAKGCIIGALCGDAIGGVLEHQTVPNEEAIKLALTLPGGGCHKLGRGQTTDDSELTLCLAQGLADGAGVLNLNKIASWYGKWVDSKPFDIGRTCRNSLPKAANMKEHQAEMVRRGAKLSIDSQSNGALMRVSPLCVWTSKLKKEDLIKAIREECVLTHPNQAPIVCNIGYAYAIQHLLNNKGDNVGAYEKCREIVKESKNKDVIEWMEGIEKEELIVANRNGGWAKIAFFYAMYSLKKGYDYVDAMKDILSRGGDTDTNCCIIGGLLGALHGYSKLPQDIVQRVLEFDPKKEKGIKRPDFLVPKYTILPAIEKILKNIPTELKLKGATDEYPPKETKETKEPPKKTFK